MEKYTNFVILLEQINRFKNMRNSLLWALVAIFSLSFDAFTASAKDIPAGMRIGIAEAGNDDNEISLFSYKDQDGTMGYYLGLGKEFNWNEKHGIELLGGTLSISDIDEVCLYLGSTADEAMASLDGLFSAFDKDVDTAFELPARLSTGSERLGDPTTVMCVVKKKFLKGKFLRFFFVSGKHNAEVDLDKSTVKFLRKGLERDMKRNKGN
jgi:hypothetical protein